MLGGQCAKVLESEHEVLCPEKEELDIVSWDRVIDMFDHISPDAVINCAGLTDMEACEDEDDYVIKKINVKSISKKNIQLSWMEDQHSKPKQSKEPKK